MDYFKWKDEYSLNIRIIDEQHQVLFKLINELYTSLMDGKTNDIIADILSSLIDYTIYHFNTEEGMFKLYNYPGYDGHKQKHDDLAQQALEMQNKLNEKSATLSFEIMDFLADWLQHHIQDEDQRYRNYFKENNIIIGDLVGK